MSKKVKNAGFGPVEIVETAKIDSGPIQDPHQQFLEIVAVIGDEVESDILRDFHRCDHRLTEPIVEASRSDHPKRLRRCLSAIKSGLSACFAILIELDRYRHGAANADRYAALSKSDRILADYLADRIATLTLLSEIWEKERKSLAAMSPADLRQVFEGISYGEDRRKWPNEFNILCSKIIELKCSLSAKLAKREERCRRFSRKSEIESIPQVQGCAEETAREAKILDFAIARGVKRASLVR